MSKLFNLQIQKMLVAKGWNFADGEVHLPIFQSLTFLFLEYM